MLDTPITSHIDFDQVYEPYEDSYLLLSTLESPAETAFLNARFASSASPLICEVGTGSGIVLAFVTAQSQSIFGRSDILTIGTDISIFACAAATKTVRVACSERGTSSRKGLGNPAQCIGVVNGDLVTPLRPHSVDVLIFNPPYVSAPLPDLEKHAEMNELPTNKVVSRQELLERDSHLLALSYAGGEQGMEVTNRLLDQLPDCLHPDHGVAYVLLCAQNKPQEVMARLREWPGQWDVQVVSNSGKQAGWEKLVVIRISRPDHR